MKRFKIVSLAACLFLMASTAQALDIQYTASGASQVQLDAFEQAVQRWEDRISTQATVNLDFSFSAMGSGVIGSTSSGLYFVRFNDVKSQLNGLADPNSPVDGAATSYVNAIPMNGNNYEWYSNGPDGNDHEYGSTWNDSDPNTPADNPWNMLATSANLKALGYTGISGDDAVLQFNTNFAFDYNPIDGISAGKMDFVGVAEHEIGHALGFVSAVDLNAGIEELSIGYALLDAVFDAQGGLAPGSPDLPPSVLDLFRHSNVYGADTVDISYDGRYAYFSHDGLTQISLSRGANGPDGRQASHWQDNLGLGLMDPTAGYGELLAFSVEDQIAFDAMGWNFTTPVPEPGSILLLSGGLLALAGTRKKKNISV